MSPSDRLSQLRRQRLVIQEHLAWLEREIAEAEKTQPGASSIKPSAGPAAPVTLPGEPPGASGYQRVTATREREIASSPAAAEETDATADEIMNEYRTASGDVRSDVRKGCLLYFVGALALLSAAVAILYFALRHAP